MAFFSLVLTVHCRQIQIQQHWETVFVDIAPNFVCFAIMGRHASQFFPVFAANSAAAVLPAVPGGRRVMLGALNQQCRRNDGR